MANSVDLKKTVYNKDHFNKVVNREFSTFVDQVAEPTLTIEEFFKAYNDLYFSIDVEGTTNSHRYLVERSSELLSFESTTDQYQVLLDEIASLRERLLLANENLVKLQTQLVSNNISPVIEQEPDLEIATTTSTQTEETSSEPAVVDLPPEETSSTLTDESTLVFENETTLPDSPPGAKARAGIPL